MKRLSPGVDQKIGSYVYRLVDPSNGETFYVGRGRGNRLFRHELEAEIKKDRDPDVASEKIGRIRRISATGQEPMRIVHRHGMTDHEAAQVEAALIDAYPGLSNLVRGKGADYGPRSIAEIETLYRAEEAEFGDRTILLISIGGSWLSDDLGAGSAADILEQTRYSWVLNPERAKRADLVLAHAHGLIRGAFTATRWYPSNDRALRNHARYRARPTAPRRFGFVGSIASKKDIRSFVSKRIPDTFRKSTGQPIQYAGSLSSKGTT
jgi:hypothetical protein